MYNNHDNRFDDPHFIKWAKAVKVRDNFTCQICDRRGVYLHAHHKNSWDKFVEERFELDNGITLCEKCHTRFHNTFGYGNNTTYQFKQYQEIAELFKSILSSPEEDVEFTEYRP
jgi:hypothetical protein